MAEQRYQVFISSTFKDLEKARRDLRFALMEEYTTLGMEHFPATPDRGWGVIEESLDRADLYVLVLGARYGQLFPGEEVSWTEREYRYAIDRSIPILVFLEDNESHTPVGVDETERLEAFKVELRRNHKYAKWRSTDQLILEVKEALRREVAKRGPMPPEYLSNASKRRSMLLQRLYEERNTLLAEGGDVTELDKEIVGIKRRDRIGPSLEPGDRLGDGRYLLLRVVGDGGFASVWQAFDSESRMDVAVRVMHSQLTRNEVSRERFHRGIRKMAQLSHPSVVEVIEGARVENGWHYCVLPFFARGDLHSAIVRGTIDGPAGMVAVLTAAPGLGHAHEQSLVHRDVSPWNILLNDSFEGVVTDFDLVFADDTTGGTRTGALGRFAYVAPEAMKSASVADRVADVFGLGMTAIFCCLRSDISPEQWRDLAATIKNLPVGVLVQRVLRKATEWDPSDRYQTVREFSQALELALDASRNAPGPFDKREAIGVRVLVVDDESFIRDIVSDFLRMQGYEVDAAENTTQALALAAKHTHHVAFIDQKLGDEDGIDALKQLLKLRPRMNAIVITGYGTVDVAVKAMKAGARDFLLKPFRVEEIIAATERWRDE